MSNTIIVETGPAEPFSLSPVQARNRKLLIRALAEGVAVQMTTPAGHWVSSRSEFGKLYLVDRSTNADGKKVERCSCEWGKNKGPFVQGTSALPCSHVLVTRWHLMDEATRESVLCQDPQLAAVAGYAESAVA